MLYRTAGVQRLYKKGVGFDGEDISAPIRQALVFVFD
jgi:hypothetical protein